MALLEYASMTTPDIVKKSVSAFYNSDPLLKRMRELNNVRRQGGEKVRIIRIKSGHSDVVQIDESNMSVPLNKKETLDTLEGDWARYIKPLIIPHFDANRMRSKEEKKEYVNKMVRAAMQAFRNDASRRMYVGDVVRLRGLGSFNGNIIDGTSEGFENGALQFLTPANQVASALTYLGEARAVDLVNFEDNWYNQHADITGIGSDAMNGIEEVKMTADTFAEEGGIEIGLLGIHDHVQLADEIRMYPGATAAALTYTIAEAEAGKAQPMIHQAAGVTFYSNRWINPGGGATNMGDALTEHIMLFNPRYVEWWVNANEDFRTTEFTDHLKTSNQDADIAYIVCEVQAAVTNLMACGTVSNP